MVSSEWLRIRRQELKLSQDDLVTRLQADGLDVSRAALSAWEIGRAPSPLDDVRKIKILANALEVDVSVLLEIADIEIESAHQSESARRGAMIIDRMSPANQKAAVEVLRALERSYE